MRRWPAGGFARYGSYNGCSASRGREPGAGARGTRADGGAPGADDNNMFVHIEDSDWGTSSSAFVRIEDYSDDEDENDDDEPLELAAVNLNAALDEAQNTMMDFMHQEADDE